MEFNCKVDNSMASFAGEAFAKASEHLGIFRLPQYDAKADSFGVSPYPETYLFRWLLAQGQQPEEVLLVVKKHFNKKDNPQAHARVKSAVHDGIDHEGRHYVVLGAGSSGLRAGSFIMIEQSWKAKILNWIQCGLDTRRNIVANKYIVYIIMSLLSSTKPWRTKTDLAEPDIHKIAVLPDCDFDIEGVFDVVENGKVNRERRTVTNKITDGIVLYMVDDDADHEEFTMRAPGWKALVVPVSRWAVYKLLAKERGKLISEFTDEDWLTRPDAWGVRQDIRELTIIGFKSAFKWVKACATADDWARYQEKFVEYGHEFSVCVTAHMSWGDMPYQQLQTLCWTKDEAQQAAENCLELLRSYQTVEGAPRLLSGAMAKVARMVPGLMLDDYSQEEMAKTYTSRRWKWMGAKLPKCGHNPFAAMDPYAIVQHVFGFKVTGLLPAKKVHCRMFRWFVTLDITRCPHLDNAHAIRENIPVPRDWRGLYLGSACFFSAHDATMNLLQMDFDGDHVFVTSNKMIVRWAIKAIKKHGNVPLFYEPKASKPSDEVTDEQIEKLLIEVDPAPVGLYAFALNKLWARGKVDRVLANRIALLTEGGNTCIDAAKYISDDDTGTLAPETKLALEADKKMKNPLFIAYAKSSPFVEGSFEKRISKSTFYPTSGCDQYTVAIRDGSDDELHIQGLDQLSFDWHDLCHGKAKRITGLCVKAERDDQGNWVDDGVFNHLVFEYLQKAPAELDADLKDEDDSYEAALLHGEMQRNAVEAIRNVVFRYGEINGADHQTTVNSLVMSVYCCKQPAVIKRALWLCFGDDILDNVQQNLSVGFVCDEEDEGELTQEEIDAIDATLDESFADDCDDADYDDVFDLEPIPEFE